MTQFEDILNELRKGTSLEEIQAKYSSVATIYKVLRAYMPEAAAAIRSLHSELSALHPRAKDLQGQVQSLETQSRRLEDSNKEARKAHDDWTTKATSERASLQQTLDKLGKAVEDKQHVLDRINAEVSALSKKGLTPELVTRILSVEFETGESLLERVRTASDHVRLQKDVIAIEKKKVDLTKECASLTTTRDTIIADIQTQKNILDEWSLKTRTYKEATTTTAWFFSQGYNTEDLKNIKKGIELVGVKGDVALSIERFVRGIEEAGSLASLHEAIRESRQELRSLQDEIASAKGQLAAIKDTVVKTLDNVANTAIAKIEKLADEAISALTKARSNASTNLDDLGRTSISEITELSKNTTRTLRELGNRAASSLTQTDLAANAIAKTLGAWVQPFLDSLEAGTKKILDSHLADITTRFHQDLEKWEEMREAAMEKKYAARIASLEENLEESRKEAAKFKSMSAELAGKQITLEEFENRALNEAKRAHGRAIGLELDSILRDEAQWPQWFKDYVSNKINQGVNNGLNAAYWTNLRAAVSNAKRSEWPRFLDEYTRKIMTPLLQKPIKDLLASMTIEVHKTCDKCRMPSGWILGPEDLAYLLTNSFYVNDCQNPQCRDLLGKHKIILSLGDVIMNLVGQPLQPSY
jgi:ABC-type transporter Mla subunit MlaD